MRLKCIRLAGFKSFVDPTTVNFPGNMTAVIGPNGCGKSNIIDAVRWVMGESSAKNLRGESMADVIFNGSNTRKPVGQASIELVFDNSDGSLLGEYAAYSEISIKRKVTRDGQSAYFLNGTRCRRRDITDIFLGTGLGPRSYSIIEQGMISRLIEARPEELRHYIEEAAGISRYKERRRETENRIRHTQENLERLTDLRQELGRQLERLERQAQAAEKYRQLKLEERQQRAGLAALRWRWLNLQAQGRQGEIGSQEVQLEAYIAEQCNADAAIERLRDGHHERAEAFNQVQARFYALGGDVARVEQSIQHSQQRLRQLQDDLRDAEQAHNEAATHLAQDRLLLEHLAEQLATLEPEQDMAEAQAAEARAAFEASEATLHAWQERWERFNQHSAAPRRQVEIQRVRIQQLTHGLQRLEERQRRLLEERQQLEQDLNDPTLNGLEEQILLEEQQIEELAAVEQQHIQQLDQLRENIQHRERDQQHLRSNVQRLEGRLASLEALQQAALDPGSACSAWLRTHHLDHYPRLSEGLRVEPGWELAVETVLGADVQALLLDEPQWSVMADFAEGEVRLACPVARSVVAGSLLEKVQSPVDMSAWLGAVRAVESLDEALAARATLAEGETAVSRDGYWVGRHFMRVRRGTGAEDSMLARARELEQLQQTLAESSAQLIEIEILLEELRAQRHHTEHARDQQRRVIATQERQLAHVRAQVSALRARQEQWLVRQRRVADEHAELAAQHDSEAEQLSEAQLLLEEALEHSAAADEQQQVLSAERDTLRVQVEQARQQSRLHEEHAHQFALKIQTLRTQQAATRQSLERLEQQAVRLSERCTQLGLNLEESDEPLEALKARLEELLEQRMALEETLREARLVLDEADRELREAERRRQQAEQSARQLRDHLEQQRLDWQTLSLRQQTLEEQVSEDGYHLATLLEVVPPDAVEAEWEEQLTQLANRIQRLGPINLAAIEEFEQQSERKRYLDAQNDDLVEALTTLDNVIRKIDRETRQRFRDTFDKVDSGLRELFPKVFGGGQAWLELTGEDLLDTGVTIMARPPGKKNSTIHLLSGGEKALTAIALVFSIFQLNPAPFCMLDEVDAPLDDANVGRYARLVREMSSKVQFIYITHNKLAMEMADQLMGVTMQEPGCSRLVAVDIEEALALAGV